MASVRTSAQESANEQNVAWELAPAARISTYRFGTVADSADPTTDAFLFTRRRDIVDGYLNPAIELAFKSNVDLAWDNWTRAAMRAASASDDLVSKRMLWMTLLVTLPDIQQWFLQNGPPNADKWLAYLKTELEAYCIGKTHAAPETIEPSAKRARKGQRPADEPSPSPLYATMSDFVCSMTAYYLAL